MIGANKSTDISVYYYYTVDVHEHNERITRTVKGKGKGTVKPLTEVFHGTATECHLPYGITL